MNGAEALIQTLCDSGVEVCFANPGTSEMQLVAAVDKQPKMRAILGLFEGVVSGAADGYGRMADKPAATILHLGPGLANAASNLHNAKRGLSSIVNIVGDHATDHLKYDAPLTSDIESLAGPVSDWVRRSKSAEDIGAAGAEAVEAALGYPGQIATLIVPADHAWTDGISSATPKHWPEAPQVADQAIADAAAALKKQGATALFLGGRALREEALEQAGRIAAATGARLVCETFATRLQRGAGRVPVERLPYFGEMAADFLKEFARIVFVGATPPVSFFAYPGKPGWLSPESAELLELAGPRDEALETLRKLADALDAPDKPAAWQPSVTPPLGQGQLDAQSLGGVLASALPENSIICDEAVTASLGIYPMTQGAARHDWLMLTGGSIGFGLPIAIGAAVACPDRKVIALEADGSAMYTIQALWTMARESLDVTTILLNNGCYAILNVEFARVGVAAPGPKAMSLLDLTRPAIDWVAISEGMGVPAVRADTVEGFQKALEDALSIKGPRLIEAVIPPGL
jgi:acetolactate synthase-1/2/3 large subunit